MRWWITHIWLLLKKDDNTHPKVILITFGMKDQCCQLVVICNGSMCSCVCNWFQRIYFSGIFGFHFISEVCFVILVQPWRSDPIGSFCPLSHLKCNNWILVWCFCSCYAVHMKVVFIVYINNGAELNNTPT